MAFPILKLFPAFRRQPARWCLGVLGSGALVWAAPVPRPLGYNADIQPILAENCFACHGPDSAARKAKLRLDRAEFATQPRDNGERAPAIVPGDAAASPLVERITSPYPDEVMPPPESHKKLKPEEIARLERWIAEGAKYQDHWSFIPPIRPAVPAVPLARGWARNPIDHFIAERLAAERLTPAREENRARLLRRLAFDLTGLPPTPAEVAAFERDRAPDAYERVVDRLLASDASAEHFARYWLDAIRYADTHGIHIDNYRSIWPYRDWVIDAFKRNLPFDQFTVEQLAGDLLPQPTLEQKIASGYNRCLPTTNEGGAIVEEYEAIYAKDQVDTMSTVWLGLTAGCASCHDHKFDAITMRDFYALSAFFRNSTMPTMDGNRHDTPPTLFIPDASDRARWPKVETEIAGLKEQLAARGKAAKAEFAQWLESSPGALTLPPMDHTVRLHRPLNERSDKAVSANANAGLTEEGSPAGSEWIDGVFGPAPRLREAAAVLGPPVPWRRGGAESFSLLVKVMDAPSATLLSCLDADAAGAGWELFLENGKLGLHVADGTGLVKVRNVAGTALAPGRWHHVLLSFDSASLRSRTIEVFANGRGAVNSRISAHLPADIIPAAPLRLGSRHAGAGVSTPGIQDGEIWVQDVRHHARGFLLAEAKAQSEVVDTFLALRTPPEKRTAAQTKLLRGHFLAAVDAPSLALGRKLDAMRAEEEAIRDRGTITLVMEEKRDAEPYAHILNRGEYSQPGEKVAANVPAALPPLPADVPRNRLALARWLVSPENPLTARVTVNRVWQQIFGTGLVESAGDFGVMGSRPSHPGLLDWLAVEFRESGWDFRRLVRLMVTSATYRQSAAIPPALLERDPGNRLLARGPRHRLDAEQLRDQALAASGLLVPKVGGRPVRPYQPEGIWEAVAMKESTTRYYRQDKGENLYRRSLYTLWKRTAPPPAMDVLNAPSREVACARRDRTNTPLQALVTLNEPLFVEASRHLAAAALREARSFDARLDVLSRRVLGRKFARDERPVLQRALAAAQQQYRRDPGAAARLLAVGDSPCDPRLPPAELAAWAVVANLILNLDEALTK